MSVGRNTKITDLLRVNLPRIPAGAHAVTQLVELPPGDGGLRPHRHSGPVFGYVLEGRILFELEGEAPRHIQAGKAFWEPGGDVVHYQVANLEPAVWSRFLTVCLCAPGVQTITMVGSDEIATRESINWSLTSRGGWAGIDRQPPSAVCGAVQRRV
jgi:quercetin dioxygenase-like cupin family protein